MSEKLAVQSSARTLFTIYYSISRNRNNTWNNKVHSSIAKILIALIIYWY